MGCRCLLVMNETDTSRFCFRLTQGIYLAPKWLGKHPTAADVPCPVFGAIHILHTYIHSLPNVPLSNKHTSMMNRLRQPQLEHLCLKTALQEVFNLQTQNIVEFHAVLIKDTYTNQPTQKGITCNQTNIQSQKPWEAGHLIPTSSNSFKQTALLLIFSMSAIYNHPF